MQRKLRALIVDDEMLARERLSRKLAEFSDRIDIIGEAANGEEALEKITALSPEVVFLDIQMPGKNGFEVIAELDKPPAIIFVTAFDSFALQAFEASAVDYLLKPVTHERLENSLQRLSQQPAENSTAAEIARLMAHLRKSSDFLRRLTLRKGDRILFIEVAEVLYFKAEDKYTFAVLSNREEIISQTLNELEEKLDGEQFVRIHRGYIINRTFLKALQRNENGRYQAIIRSRPEVGLPISKGYRRNLFD